MDGHGFITLAGKLDASITDDEATYRTAVSRAYYGAFHVARSFLMDLGFPPLQNASVHGLVRQYLNGSGHRDAILAASHLRRLQAERNNADYDLDDADPGSRESLWQASNELTASFLPSKPAGRPTCGTRSARASPSTSKKSARSREIRPCFLHSRHRSQLQLSRIRSIACLHEFSHPRLQCSDVGLRVRMSGPIVARPRHSENAITNVLHNYRR
jgi:uncharacterized protein (UPF0332 family)